MKGGKCMKTNMHSRIIGCNSNLLHIEAVKIGLKDIKVWLQFLGKIFLILEI
jgi:hypothetical protein